MGYYTRYELSVKLSEWDDECDVPKDASAEQILLDDDDWGQGPLLDIYRALLVAESPALTEEPCKWYDYEADMRAVSRKFPDVLFALSGEGDEQGDVWKAWFLGGRMQREVATFQIGEYDPEKLDTPQEGDAQ